MTPDEQAFLDRLDGVLTSLEVRIPSIQRLRQVPMDMVAIAVMRQMASDGLPRLDDDVAIESALVTVASRNGSAQPVVIR